MAASIRELAASRLQDPEATVRHGRWFARLGTPDALASLHRSGGVRRLDALRLVLIVTVARVPRRPANGVRDLGVY